MADAHLACDAAQGEPFDSRVRQHGFRSAKQRRAQVTVMVCCLFFRHFILLIHDLDSVKLKS